MKKKRYLTMMATVMAASLSLSAAAAPMGRTELKMGLSSSVQDKVQPTKRYSKEQLKAVEQEIKKLKKSYEDISDCKIDEKKNRVVVTVVGTVVPKLKNALANIPNKNAVEVVVVPDEDGFGDESVPPQEQVPPSADSQPTHRDERFYATLDLGTYLEETVKLNDKSYSYVDLYPEEGRVVIGVPTVKNRERAMSAVNAYPNKGEVRVEYCLCPYSYHEIYEAYKEIIKDSFIKKNKANKKIYDVDHWGDCIRILYREKVPGLEEWRNTNKYADMIALEPYQN